MKGERFLPKAGQLVCSVKLPGVFAVIGVSVGGKDCVIQPYDVSKRNLMDKPKEVVPCSEVFPFEEDASQAAARIVRETMKEK